MKLFYVYKKIEQEGISTDVIYTVVAKYNHAEEYIQNSLRIDNFNHFKPWCDLRGLDFRNPLSWLEYKKVVRPLNEYKIKSVRYNKYEMAELLRISNGCMAIGCSFDSKLERSILLNLSKLSKSE